MKTSLSGFPIVSGQEILKSSTVQAHELGAYMETPDGRGFRYCKVGSAANTVAGKVYQAAAEDTTNQTLSGGFATAAAAIGATTIVTTTTGTIAVNALAGGYMSVVVTPGQGYTYKIQSNAVAVAAAYSVELEDPLVIALTVDSNVIFTKHPYNGIIIDPGTLTGICVGVAPAILTLSQYGWVQTKGACAVLFKGTGVTGKAVGSLVSGTSGACAPAIAATNILGYNMSVSIDAEYAMIYLTIG